MADTLLHLLTSPDAWLSLGVLTLLEIVLGIDNILVIAIVANRLPSAKRNQARLTGLTIAIFTRGLMLAGVQWLTQLKEPIFSLFDQAFSGRDMVLFSGGLFLLWKAVHEMHHAVENPVLPDDEDDPEESLQRPLSFVSALVQMVLLDLVFSLDTVITAVGLANDLIVMIAAITVAILIMMTFAGALADYIHARPTLTILALAFLMLIGMMLVLDAFHIHVPRGYLYAAMGFSLGVELLHLRLHKNEDRKRKRKKRR